MSVVGYDLKKSNKYGVLSHDFALFGYTGPGTTWANEMNFVMIPMAPVQD